MIKRIVTHSGVFHADEIFACTILSMITDGNIEVERTRKITEEMRNDPEVCLVDVGGVHEPRLNNFDHHQKNDSTVEGISAFGLVFATWGNSLITKNYPNQTTSFIKFVVESMRRNLVHPIDLWDTGQILEGDVPDNIITLPALIKKFNLPNVYSDTQNHHFKVVMNMCNSFIKTEMATAKRILNAFDTWEQRETVLPHTIFMNDFCIVWSKKNQALDNPAWFAIWPTYDEDNNMHYIVKAHNSRYAHLIEYDTDCIYHHPNNFQAGYRTLDAAIQCAKLSEASKNAQIKASLQH